MPRSARILLATWDGAGNLWPELSLVRALVARGHRVSALAHDSARETIERHGAHHVAVRSAPHYDSRRPMPPNEEMPFVVEHIWFSRAFGSELLAAVDGVGPDLLLVDVNLAYALVAARRSGLPTAVLCHIPYGLLLGPFAPLLESRLQATNAYAAELELAPFSSHRALVEASPLVLVSSFRAFDSLEAAAPNVVHVGPCRYRPDGAETWRRREPQRPLVLVALSTSHQNQVPLLQRLCDALGSLEVEALVTTGPAIAPESLRSSDNTSVERFVSHDLVLSAADLLITHAGHGTVMAGVTYGTPMLCFPMGRDQPIIADRVAQLGIGEQLAPEATVSEIGRSIAAILTDAAVKERAREFARPLADHPGVDDAATLVESLLPTRM